MPHARYIDAGTGRLFPVIPKGSSNDLPFAGVDLVFNHENVWVARAGATVRGTIHSAEPVESADEHKGEDAGSAEQGCQEAVAFADQAVVDCPGEKQLSPPPAVLDFANCRHWEPLLAMAPGYAPTPRPARTLRALQSMALSFKARQWKWNGNESHEYTAYHRNRQSCGKHQQQQWTLRRTACAKRSLGLFDLPFLDRALRGHMPGPRGPLSTAGPLPCP